MRALVIVVGLFVPAVAVAEVEPMETAPRDQPGPRPEVQLDLGLSVIGVAYEQPVAPHVAVQVEVDTTSTYFAPWFDAGDSLTGFAAGLRASWFARPGLTGLYVAPFVRVARMTHDDAAGVGVSGGAFVGWAWRVSRHVDVRLGVGAQYIDYKVGAVGMSTPFFALDGVVGYRL